MTTNAIDTHAANVSRCSRCGSTTRTGGSARAKLRAKRVRERTEFLERLARLSDREHDVVMMIARGVMPAEIAEALQISPRTVSTFRTRALAKLEMRTTAEIAVAAYNAGLIE